MHTGPAKSLPRNCWNCSGVGTNAFDTFIFSPLSCSTIIFSLIALISHNYGTKCQCGSYSGSDGHSAGNDLVKNLLTIRKVHYASRNSIQTLDKTNCVGISGISLNGLRRRTTINFALSLINPSIFNHANHFSDRKNSLADLPSVSLYCCCARKQFCWIRPVCFLSPTGVHGLETVGSLQVNGGSQL